ncbi:hypothetical protein [Nocardia asteroides]
MVATVGISAELAAIRGVLLSNPSIAHPQAKRSVERGVDLGGSITSVVDALTETQPLVEDVAVAYRTPQERKKIVSALASGKWRTSSLVSTRAALFALVGGTSELDEFRTVVLVDLVDRTATAVVVGADRGQLLASDSWSTGFDGETGPGEVDTDPMRETIGRVRAMLASIPTHPSAIALCGSQAAAPEIATALHAELLAPVVLLPDFADATARGAALIAADRAGSQSAPAPEQPRNLRRLAWVAGVAAALVTAGFAVTQVLTDTDISSSTVTTVAPNITASPLSDPTTAIAPRPAAPVPLSPTGSTPSPTTVETPTEPGPPTAAPDATPSATAPTASLRDPQEPGWVPTTAGSPRVAATTPGSPPTAATSESPTSTKVGDPGPDGLFPGEAPPPPAGTAPAAERAWWDNHLQLKNRWLHGG